MSSKLEISDLQNKAAETERIKLAHYINKYINVKKAALLHFDNGRLEESLVLIHAASKFASTYHLGFWYDDDLENLLSFISYSMFQDTYQDPPKNSKTTCSQGECKVLYIATFLDKIGGHSEVMRLWLSLLSKKKNIKQYVITTFDVDPGFLSKIQNADITFLNLNEDTLTNKIRSLVFNVLDIKPTFIILFINPEDIVSITAMNFIKKIVNAKIIFYNHGDIVFWLGRNVIDILVEFSPHRAYVSRDVRKYKGNIAIIPLTTDIVDRNPSKFNPYIKTKHATISLSIGSPWKIVNDGFWDYLGTIKKILESNPNHTHVLLTFPRKYITKRIAMLKEWPEDLLRRLIIKYNIADPTYYYNQADFLIETFPFAGGQVRIEAMALGLPVIFIQNPKFSLVFLHSDADSIVEDYPFIAKSNEDVIKHANTLIGNYNLRHKYGNFLREIFAAKSSAEVTFSKLESLLNNDYASCNSTPCESVQKIYIDDSYLFSFDLNRDYPPSPYVWAMINSINQGRFRLSTLIEYLKNLKLEDWWWCFSYLKYRLRWLFQVTK